MKALFNESSAYFLNDLLNVEMHSAYLLYETGGRCSLAVILIYLNILMLSRIWTVMPNALEQMKDIDRESALN